MLLLAAAALFAAPVPVGPARDIVIDPFQENALCPETPMSVARKMGRRPPSAIPLSKLPPALTFMAVDRRIDGCPAPLTATEYRRASSRR